MRYDSAQRAQDIEVLLAELSDQLRDSGHQACIVSQSTGIWEMRKAYLHSGTHGALLLLAPNAEIGVGLFGAT